MKLIQRGHPFADRAAEKALSRQNDERDLASGKKSREELARENGHFAGLNVRVNYKQAKSHH